jgi:hypothetical protein
MDRLQFSLTGLLAIVLVLAIACATIISGQEVVASAATTAWLALLAFAITGVACRRGTKQVFWIGFLVFGVTYSAASNLVYSQPWYLVQVDSGDLLTEKLLQAILSRRDFRPRVGSLVEAKWVAGSYYAARITEIGDDGLIHVVWLDGSGDQWTPPRDVRANLKVHYATARPMFCMLIALIGACIAQAVFAPKSSERPDAGARAV